ncbi:peptidoglycan-binding domain-containing protein [Nonomuraea recticatena]|uniref:Peptidoglycan binding-like domain-containing protein n=1 Tax=Nonomuraea recticatena TaxID=46178 RepID=A0ABN3T2B2_9ACTN
MATSAPATWSRTLVYVKSRQVMRGPDVAAWQARLRELGYQVAVDGRYEPTTAEATRRFQADRGLLVTGTVDKTTARTAGEL